MPRAEKGLSAPGGRKNLLSGAEKGFGAPGGQEKRLPGAERERGAPDGWEKRLPGRRKTAVSRAGDNVVVFLVRWTRLDFGGVYQVHPVWI